MLARIRCSRGESGSGVLGSEWNAAGMAEIIKYGPITDVSFLDWIDANLSLLIARDPATLGYTCEQWQGELRTR